MTMLGPQGTPQQEYSLIELEQARSAELEAREPESQRIAAARAASGEETLSTRIVRAIRRRLRRG